MKLTWENRMMVAGHRGDCYNWPENTMEGFLAAIEAGIKPTGSKYEMIENRREAIRQAMEIAVGGDIIVLAGKGHETYQEIEGVKYPFDEKVVVSELLEEMKKD